MARKKKADKSETGNSDAEKKPKNILGLLTPVFVLGAAFAGNWFLVDTKAPAPATQETAQKKEKAASWTPPPAKHVIELNPIVVSISPSDKLLKIGLALETTTPDIEPDDPVLKDALTTYLRSVTPQMLTEPEFHTQLKKQLLHRARHSLGHEKVQGLLITDYLLS
jgi:flagellar basal body-associated protein FliL